MGLLGSFWVVVDCCGSIWVVPRFSNYGQQTCASMIVCIEAVKHRNTSGDIYHDKRTCTMMCLYRKETLRFAFIVSMPKTNSVSFSTWNCIFMLHAIENR